MTLVPRAMLVALAAGLLPIQGGVSVDEIPLYVGRGSCLECHGADRESVACAQQPVPEHLRAHQALSRPEAEHIAFLSGVAEAPTESLVCLGCHSTGADAGLRWAGADFRIENGVQCEACHNAGGLHVQAHRSGKEQETSTRLPVPTRQDEATCGTCHMDRSSHHDVLTGGFRRSPVQQLYKTPVNLTVSPSGDRLYLVCEHSDSVVVLDPHSGRVIDEIEVGRRPADAALSPDGRKLYVTNRLSSSLTVIDTSSGDETATIAVGSEPRGVLASRDGRSVFVLNTGQNTISVLDARDLTEKTRLAAGVGPWSMAIHPDGSSLCVTNSRPNPGRFRDPPVSELTLVSTRKRRVQGRPTVPEANMLQGIAFVPDENVVLFTMMRTKNLVPMSRIAQGWVITNGLGVLWGDGRVDQVLLDEPTSSFPDPNDIAVSPDGRWALVTSGGSDSVAVLDVSALLGLIRNSSDRERSRVLPDHMGMSDRFVVARIAVGRNPRGVAFSPDGRFAYVANALDDSVSVIDAAEFRVSAEIPLGGPEEVTQARRGERLFHSADNAFGRQFSCRSCHPGGHTNGLTFDIEADGLGLTLVDNRTLRGILDTAPFKWEGTNPSLRRQCGARLAVFFTRLDPFTPQELDALVRYISTIERPPNPNRPADGLTPSQRRGKMIFDRTTDNSGRALSTTGDSPLIVSKACTACHRGSYGTTRISAAVGTDMWFDSPGPRNRIVDLEDEDSFGRYGLVYYSQSPKDLQTLDVPHLNNLYSSAPYLHNGTAATLEEIWTRFNLYDWHGVTNDLTRRQFIDLIAYLKAL